MTTKVLYFEKKAYFTMTSWPRFPLAFTQKMSSHLRYFRGDPQIDSFIKDVKQTHSLNQPTPYPKTSH